MLEDIDLLEAEETAEETSDAIAAALAAEREQLLELELYHDEHPTEREPEDAAENVLTVVKHEMLKTAISRIENAARTQADFENVVACWNKLEQNAARRLRDHEVSRGDVPLEFGKAMDGAIFPAHYMEPNWRLLMRGIYIDLIHDCPFELDELVSDNALIYALRKLKAAHKEIFYLHYIRRLSCAEIGVIRKQTDRNIRKTRAVILRKLRKELARALDGREKLTYRQASFLEQMKRAALDDNKDSNHELCREVEQ